MERNTIAGIKLYKENWKENKFSFKKVIQPKNIIDKAFFDKDNSMKANYYSENVMKNRNNSETKKCNLSILNLLRKDKFNATLHGRKCSYENENNLTYNETKISSKGRFRMIHPSVLYFQNKNHSVSKQGSSQLRFKENNCTPQRILLKWGHFINKNEIKFLKNNKQKLLSNQISKLSYNYKNKSFKIIESKPEDIKINPIFRNAQCNTIDNDSIDYQNCAPCKNRSVNINLPITYPLNNTRSNKRKSDIDKEDTFSINDNIFSNIKLTDLKKKLYKIIFKNQCKFSSLKSFLIEPINEDSSLIKKIYI